MRHQVGQAMIIIPSTHTTSFCAWHWRAFGYSQRISSVPCEAGKVEVGKNMAQQDQPLESILLQGASGLARMARLCPEMQIGEEQRVVRWQIHTSVLPADCYARMKVASNWCKGNSSSN